MSRSHGLAARYRRALAAYLRGNDPEAALLESYDCGRQALADGRSLLDLAALYHEALLVAGLHPLLDEDARRLMAAGQAMLSQTLVPFEVARRGFAEANLALRELNEDLERRVAERTQQLEAALQVAEEASRHKSAFLANMSHELRTPLNAILGFSDLLLDEPAEGYDPPTRLTFLETIHSSGQHLLGLINDILDLAKIEAGRLELYPEQFQVAAAVAQVLSTVEPLASRKAIALVADAAEAGELVADEGKIKQILYNLLSNAIKFTPQGGEVVLMARGLPEAVQVTVADTGIGIAHEDQERIFEEFQQVDAGPDRRYEGTGLGLSLTRRLVDLHGGRIWVESAPGEGCRFHVVLPRDAPIPAVHTPHHMPAAMPTEPDNRPLVLVVEDDPRSASLISMCLARGGYRTEVATDGRTALDKARALQPVAITLDILLPGLDGWEVLRTLKLDAAACEIPVIVVSVGDELELGYALGATDYLVKPVARQALLACVRRYVSRPDAPPRQARVLVVDDEPSAVELLDNLLTAAGCLALRAGGGAEGIALARSERPDLVLLDLMMPDVDGFKVVATLKADPAARDIPIVVITAKSLTDEDRRVLNGQVVAVLQKEHAGRVDLVTWLDELMRRLGVGAYAM